LYAAAALGVADQLVAGPAPAEVLAERAGAHAPSLYRLVRTLASVGVFTEPEPGVFNLTPLGQTLTSGQPGSMRDVVIMFMETHYAPFGELIHTIRTGQPAAEHLYGEPFFTWLSPHPGQAERYTAAMANLTGGFKTAAIASLPLDDTHTIVDVGGADGTVLAAILAAHPHLRGVLFDLPHVITAAPQTLARQGVEDRAECVGGDFFESVPAGGLPALARAARLARPASPAHPGQHRRRRPRRTAAGTRLRGTGRRRPAHVQDVRPEHAGHDGRQGTHRTRMA
jgi:O-methyltransferase domain